MKIAFFWTGDFSKNILENIIQNKEISVELVVSQPDKPVGRKKIITPTPVKEAAHNHNIEVLQPIKLKNNIDFFERLKWFDFIVVVAYWKIVPKEVLEAPKYWCINIHWSILPKYRWASPIQEAIKNWDKETWLTIMYMSEWMDEWDILNIQKTPIDIMDKTPDIFKKFENIWAELLINTLKQIINWEITAEKQNNHNATYCSKINKSDWEIFFKENFSDEIYNKFRAYNPWPTIYSYYNNKKLTIQDCFFQEINWFEDKKAWDVVKIEFEWKKIYKVWIVCKKWILVLKEIKLEWKKSMDILSFINWNKDFLSYNFK